MKKRTIGIIGLIIIVGLIGLGLLAGDSNNSKTDSPKPASFHVVDASMKYSRIPIGSENKINATIENKGDEIGQTTIYLYALKGKTWNDEEAHIADSKDISLEGHHRKTIEFTIEPTSEGSWLVEIGETTYRFDVLMVVKANDLAHDWDENQVAAKQKYKDKEMYVTGIVDDIGVEIMGHPYLILETDFLLPGIQCVFEKKFEDEIAKIEKGDEIIAVGKCKGYPILNVLIDDCELLDVR